MKTMAPEHLSSTSLPLQGDPEAMIADVKSFLGHLPSTIEKSTEFSVKVRVCHPDGLWFVAKIKCFLCDGRSVLEWRRYQGDTVLYHLVWKHFLKFLTTAQLPSSFIDALSPAAPRLRPTPRATDDVPALSLDSGEKRKSCDA